MRAAGPAGLLRRRGLLLLLLLTVAATAGAADRTCRKTGCCYSKQGGKYRSMECSYADPTHEAVITKEDQPSPLEVMKFAHAARVTINHNALTTRAHLRQVSLTDIGRLTLKENSQPQVRHNGGTSMYVDRVTHVQMDSGSFFGWRSRGSVITVRNADSCHVARGAFPSAAVFRRVRLENITSLTLESGAFQATITELTLKNVTMATCPTGAFGGQIERLALLSVTVDDVQPYCVAPRRPWRELTVGFSRLGHVSPYGISGFIADASIIGSAIARVDTQGFRLSVSNFTVKSCKIDELHRDGLWVRSTGPLSLQRCHIARLSENAFRSLRVNTSAGHRVLFGGLSVQLADRGALKFAPATAVLMKELSVNIPTRCNLTECDHLRSVAIESASQPAAADPGDATSIDAFFRQAFPCEERPEVDAVSVDEGMNGAQPGLSRDPEIKDNTANDTCPP